MGEVHYLPPRRPVNDWAIQAGPASEIPDDYQGSVYPWHPDGVPRDHHFMPWFDTDTGRLICAKCREVSDGCLS